MTIKLLLTNRIENTNSLDRLANRCLAPLHGLLQVSYGAKSVRTFEIKSINIAAEIPSFQRWEWTAKKILQIMLNILLVIPGTVLGAAIKAGLFLTNEQFQRNCELINRFNEPILPFPPELNQLALSFLGPQDLSTIPLMNRELSDAVQASSEISSYRIPEAIAKDREITSLLDAAKQSLTYAAQEHFDEPLCEVFGGVDNILTLKLYKTDAPLTVESLRAADFSTYPSIFRLVRNADKPNERSSVIVMKYTMLIPKRFKEDKETIIHSFLLLNYINERWSWGISDGLEREQDNRRINGFERYRIDWYKPFFSHLREYFGESDKENINRIKKFISGRPEKVGLKNPSGYLLEKYRATFYDQNNDPCYFSFYPIVLGHVSAETIWPQLSTIPAEMPWGSSVLVPEGDNSGESWRKEQQSFLKVSEYVIPD